MTELKEKIKSAIKNYPQIKNELIDLYEAAQMEIEEGGSEYHEIQLALESLKELTDNEPTPAFMGEVQAHFRQFETMELDLQTLRIVAKNILKEFSEDQDSENDLETFIHGIFTCGNWQKYK